VVEIGETADVYGAARHPYTRALLSAVPVPDPEIERRRTRIILQGDVPSPMDPPPGCRFASRCPIVEDRCRTSAPSLAQAGANTSLAACWRTAESQSLMPDLFSPQTGETIR
jgi:oligopeptide/dipeptide ABC transporter ATP-binding protein